MKIHVEVVETETCNPSIRRLVLARVEGGALPGFEAGAHIRVQVVLSDGREDWRAYSLITSAAPEASRAPSRYEIAVRLEDAGQGGSRYMHGLQLGQRLTIEPPRNDFPLDISKPAPVLLLAGGIGVTPLIGMAAHCKAGMWPVRMVYAGRARDQMAFVPLLQTLLGEALTLHVDEQAGAPFDVAGALAGCAADEQVYVCGPRAMLDAVLAQAERMGWPRGRIHFEVFATAAAQTGDRPFELVLGQSGQHYTVTADQTILACLLAHGHDPLYDCQRGECGVCAVPVLEGDVDHRDHSLSAAEKATGKVIQICISRAKGDRLVLDL